MTLFLRQEEDLFACLGYHPLDDAVSCSLSKETNCLMVDAIFWESRKCFLQKNMLYNTEAEVFLRLTNQMDRLEDMRYAQMRQSLTSRASFHMVTRSTRELNECFDPHQSTHVPPPSRWRVGGVCRSKDGQHTSLRHPRAGLTMAGVTLYLSHACD